MVALNRILKLEDNSDFMDLTQEQKDKIELAQKEYLNGKYLTSDHTEKDILECIK